MVMHSRKPQRMNDGYFEKHQSHSYQSSKYNSKRDYERERSSNYRDRDISPVGSGGGSIGGALNNGTSSSYRSQSPEVDSPSSRGHVSSHDIRDRADHRGGGGGGGDRFSYIQKMRDRDRELYKKDKYLDKRDRRIADRDSESHRTNHDRIDRRGGAGSSSGSGAKICSSGGGGDNKRSGSDDRERERDRDRDRERDLRDKRERDNIRERERERDRERERERERDRDRDRNNRADERERDRGNGGGNGSGERVARCGDWSEHVSSSGKMYYYNCKTEVSQWEKPKEWIDRERNVARDQHREKDYREKEREREERFSRSSYAKHSSSRGSSRVRWNYDNDGGPPNHRRRLDGRMPDNADMDISPGDSTPTSEANYSLTGTPTGYDGMGVGAGQPHNNDQTLPSTTVGLPNALPRLASHPNASACGSHSTGAGVGPSMHYAASVGSHCGGAGVVVGGATMLPATGLASTSNVLSNTAAASQHRKLDGVQSLHYQSHLIAVGSPNATTASSSNQGDHNLNSNAPGPPAKVSTKDPALLMRQQSHHLNSSDGHILSSSQVNDINHHMVSQAGHHSLRENTLNASCHGMSPMSYTKSPMGTSSLGGGTAASHASNLVASCSGLNVGSSASISYSSAHSYGLKNVTDGSGSNNLVLNNISGNAMPSHMGATNHSAHGSGSILPCEGPPTPTQELDISGNPTMDMQQQRKMDNTTSASLSNLQSCVSNSIQAGRCQGPEISTKLSKYFRADLITHVTNWAADHLEKQSQKCSEEAHLYGDIQCTKISAELKCARSLVRITEITATLQEQKIMYLRQQIHRLEQSKSQNSFMSDDL